MKPVSVKNQDGKIFKFYGFFQDSIETNEGILLFPVAIIEDEEGSIIKQDVSDIRFIKEILPF